MAASVQYPVRITQPTFGFRSTTHSPSYHVTPGNVANELSGVTAASSPIAVAGYPVMTARSDSSTPRTRRPLKRKWVGATRHQLQFSTRSWVSMYSCSLNPESCVTNSSGSLTLCTDRLLVQCMIHLEFLRDSVQNLVCVLGTV